MSKACVNGFDKRYSYSFFSKKCFGCFHRNSCIRASAFNNDKRKYLLELRGYQLKPTDAMQHGIDFHSHQQEGILTLQHHGITGYFTLLKDGVYAREAKICSPSLGFRGSVDILYIKSDREHYHIEITEIKSGFKPTYFLQAAVYVSIFNGPRTLIHFSQREAYELYDLANPRIDVDVKFKIESQGKVSEEVIPFIRENQFLSKPLQYFNAVMRRAKNFRYYHNPYRNYSYLVQGIPYCRGCSYESPLMNCSFQSICYHQYQHLQSLQMKFGKRGGIIKT